MDLITLICGGALIVGITAALLRWFRVAQREQYVPGYTSRFDARWRWSSTTNLALYAVALLAALLSFWIIPLSLVTAAVLVVGPLGLGIRGSTAQLVWTRRMMTIAAVTIAIDVMLAIIGFFLAPVAILAFIALGQSAIVDLALQLLAPIEHRGARGWMGRAADAMGSQRPTVVAITGSYGKTTTKEVTRQLLAGTYDVVASPASFNNLGGLARTITEHVGPATEVLIAEMGTYGPGEIAELCSFLPPTVAVITA
ncbi:MAG: Mur ligase family protein, partial [Candidatus Limnocylindrales bacterium]